MNILQIIPNKGWGGGEKIVFELSESQLTQGDKVIVAIPDCPIVSEKFAASVIPHVIITFKGVYGVLSLSKLVRLIHQNNIEIVHTHIFKHAATTLLAKWLYGLKIKVVLTRHICKPGKKSLHYPALYRNLDKLILVSNYAKDAFMASSPPIDESKITVIHNSIKTDQTPAEPFDTSSAVELVTRIKQEMPTKVLIGFAGGISHAKGVDLAISALGKIKERGIPDFHLFIAGRGSEQYISELNKLITRYDLSGNVSFIGFTSDTLGFYKQMDLVVCPSRITEAGSLSVLEAMASASVVIATDSSPVEYIQTGQEGIVVPRNDESELEAAILQLIGNRDLITQMSAMGHARFERQFTYDKMLSQYNHIYKSL